MMDIRTKGILVVILPLVSLAVGLGLVISLVIFSVARIDDETSFRRALHTAGVVLKVYEEELARVASDYARWDNTCQFIKDLNQPYKDENLIADTFVRNRISVMVFFNADRKMVYSAQYDASQDSIVPASSDLLSVLQKNPSLCSHDSIEDKKSGMLVMSDSLNLIASIPIFASDGTGPVKGALVFIRKIDNSFMDSLGLVTDTGISIVQLGSDLSDMDAMEAMGNNTIAWQMLDHSSAMGYMEIPDILGKPAIEVRLPLQRRFNDSSHRSLFFVFLSLACLSLTAILILLRVMDHLVLRRISFIEKSIRKIEETGDVSLRVDLSGKDSLAMLAKHLNSMLGRIQASQKAMESGEISLKAEKARAELYLELAEVMIVALDRDGRVRLVNREACEVLGLPAEQIVGRSWFDSFLPADAKEEVRSYFNVLMREGFHELSRHENAVINVKGQRRLISWKVMIVYDADGKPSGTLSSGQDVTDAVGMRKSMELTLHQWETTFDGMRDGIALLDTDGRILRANAAMKDLMKTASSSEWRGMMCADLMHAGDRPADCPFMRARKNMKRETMVLRHQNHTFDVTVDPLIVNGVFAGAVHVMSDITDQEFLHEELYREHEELQGAMDELKRTHIRMVEQERMNALVRMASGIAHEINNLLSPILGFSELFITAPHILDNREETMKMIHEIHTAALDARQVMRRLRELYRPADREVRVPLNVPDVLDGAISLTSPKWQNEASRAGATIEIKKQYSQPATIAGNEAELRELFMNLILNSVDAMPKGGEIEFTVEPAGDFVEVRVRDTGCGIPESMMPHLFEVFRTTKGEEGSGLGLAVVQKIVVRHEGTISISSKVDHGTIVTVRLPLKKDALPSSKKSLKIAAPSRQALILVVDDEDKVRSVMLQYVKRLGHNVVEADSGQAAMEIVKAQDVELVITDMAMAGMNGAELAAAIKNVRPAMPIILYTGFGDIMLVEHKLPQGVDLILAKPVTLHELSSAIRSLLKL